MEDMETSRVGGCFLSSFHSRPRTYVEIGYCCVLFLGHTVVTELGQRRGQCLWKFFENSFSFPHPKESSKQSLPLPLNTLLRSIQSELDGKLLLTGTNSYSSKMSFITMLLNKLYSHMVWSCLHQKQWQLSYKQKLLFCFGFFCQQP